jgi:hypothetical protein
MPLLSRLDLHALAPSPFARSASRLIDMGYRVIPLIPREKRPGVYKGLASGYEGMPDWSKWATQDVEEWRMAQWLKWPDANIGLLHTDEFIAIDFDNDFKGIHDRIKEVLARLQGTVVRRQGKPGTYMQYFRANGDIKSAVYRLKDEGNLLEVLALGRQSVAAQSVHPQGHIYQIITDDSLEDTSISDLPLVTIETIAEIEVILREAGWDEKQRQQSQSTSGPVHGGGGIMTVTNRRAMCDLDAWVPDLGLPNLDSKGNGGWKATAHWRAGGTGRPLHERKQNLHIGPLGIVDFGTNEKFTPIDLVMRANGTDADGAWEWLWKRVGEELPPYNPKNQRTKKLGGQEVGAPRPTSHDQQVVPPKQTLGDARQKWKVELAERIAPAISAARGIRSQIFLLRADVESGEND